MYDLAFISGPDMIIVMIVALLVFGPKRLPEVGRQLGAAMRELRKMTSDFTDVVHTEMNSVHQAVAPPPIYSPRPGPVDMEHAPHSIGAVEEITHTGESPMALAASSPVAHPVSLPAAEAEKSHGEQK